MARPKGPESARKTQQVIIRCTEHEKRKVEKAAKKAKLSQSEYGRLHIPELS